MNHLEVSVDDYTDTMQTYVSNCQDRHTFVELLECSVSPGDNCWVASSGAPWKMNGRKQGEEQGNDDMLWCLLPGPQTSHANII